MLEFHFIALFQLYRIHGSISLETKCLTFALGEDKVDHESESYVWAGAQDLELIN